MRGSANAASTLDDDFEGLGFAPANHLTPGPARTISRGATALGSAAQAMFVRTSDASSLDAHDSRKWLPRAQERVASLRREATRTQPSDAVAASVNSLLSLFHLVNLKPSRIV